MFFAFIYLLLRRLVQLVGGSSNRLDSDVEVAVRRHQLRVLRRQVGRPRLRRRDRLCMTTGPVGGHTSVGAMPLSYQATPAGLVRGAARGVVPTKGSEPRSPPGQ